PDVTISKIRFLESQGLVNPERTPSGYRKFFEPDVERLRWVLRQQREHFLPLKVIKGRLENDGETFTGEGMLPLRGHAEPSLDPSGEAPFASSVAHAGRGPAVAVGETSEHVQGAPTTPVTLSTPPAPVAAYTQRSSTGGDHATRQVDPSRGPADTAGKTESAGGAYEAPTTSGRTTTYVRPAPTEGAPVERDDPAQSSTLPSEYPGEVSHRVPSGLLSPGPRTEGAQRAPTRTQPAIDPALQERVGVRPTGGAAVARGSSQVVPGQWDAAGAVDTPLVKSAPSRRAAPDVSGPSATPGAPSRSGRPTPSGRAGTSGADIEGATLTLEELASAAGLTREAAADLESYGLISGRTVGGVTYFDARALTVANLAAGFAAYGVEARHLRIHKHAAEREAGFIEQVVLPLLKQRNPEARQRAEETVAELSSLGMALRAVLVESALHDQIGG
ncbi:MAG TPA: MerR family transcriptional regulator, partial [Acidimicrobiales bacterium]|nr:MerR family transcriptional regulator [Acidimicrobiales bacterium]